MQCKKPAGHNWVGETNSCVHTLTHVHTHTCTNSHVLGTPWVGETNQGLEDTRRAHVPAHRATCLVGRTCTAWREQVASAISCRDKAQESKVLSLTSVLVTQPEPIQVDGSMAPDCICVHWSSCSLTPKRYPVPHTVLFPSPAPNPNPFSTPQASLSFKSTNVVISSQRIKECLWPRLEEF